MISLVIIFVVFGSLLPLMMGAQHSLHVKKERTSAVETLHEAAREMKLTGASKGQRLVNGISYRWEMTDQLCVTYVDFKDRQRKICIQ